MASPQKESKFQCQYCTKKWKSRADLQRHVITHNVERPYDCFFEDCTYFAKRPETLRAHMEKCPHQGNKKKTLNNGLDSDGYMNTPAGQKAKARALKKKEGQVVTLPTRPTNCGVAKPVGNHEDSAGPVSVVDEEVQASGTDIETEEARETPEGEGPAPATDHNAQKNRVKSEPVENVEDNGPHFEEPAYTFSCPFCVKKKAKAEEEPDDEKREKRLRKIKRVAWPTKGELTRHVMYHRGKYAKKQNLYVCQVHDCNVDVFTDLETFLVHQKSHPQLEHVCMSTNCPYRLESRTDLLEHLTTHDHETPFVCRRPNCDKEFQYYTARQIHEDNHFEPISMPEASDVESCGDFKAGADGQTERSSTDATRVANTGAEPSVKDEHEEEPQEEPVEEDSEDDLEAEMEADIDSETGERVVDSDSEVEDFITANQRAEVDAYQDWRAGLGEIDNQFLVAKRSRKLAKVAMDKFESDELFYSWLLHHSGKNFAVEQEKMLENRVKDAHERYLGARILNLGSMRMDPLAMGQVERILMEWVMDKATDAEGNAFKTIGMSEEPKTDEDIKKSKGVKTTDMETLAILRDHY